MKPSSFSSRAVILGIFLLHRVARRCLLGSRMRPELLLLMEGCLSVEFFGGTEAGVSYVTIILMSLLSAF